MALQIDIGTFAGRRPAEERPVLWAFASAATEFWVTLRPGNSMGLPGFVRCGPAGPPQDVEIAWFGRDVGADVGGATALWTNPTVAAQRAHFLGFVQAQCAQMTGGPLPPAADFDTRLVDRAGAGQLPPPSVLFDPGFYRVWQTNAPPTRSNGLPLGWVWLRPGGMGEALETWCLRVPFGGDTIEWVAPGQSYARADLRVAPWAPAGVVDVPTFKNAIVALGDAPAAAAIADVTHTFS